MYNNTKPTAVEPPTVQAIVALYLREHGYDGLCGENCGCAIADMCISQTDIPLDCVAAYRRPATQADIDESGLSVDFEVGDMIFSPKKEG